MYMYIVCMYVCMHVHMFMCVKLCLQMFTNVHVCKDQRLSLAVALYYSLP